MCNRFNGYGALWSTFHTLRLFISYGRFLYGGGYCYKDHYNQSIENLFAYLHRRIKTLWIPFFCINSVSTLFNNILINLNLYTTNPDIQSVVKPGFNCIKHYMDFREVLTHCLKQLFFSDSTQLGGATWFFRIMFGVSILYAFISLLIRGRSIRSRNWIQFAVSLAFLLLGYVCSLSGYMLHGFVQILSCYWLFYLGQTIKRYNLNDYIRRIPHLYVIISFMALLVLCKVGTVDIASNTMTNPAFFVASSIAGWIFLYSISEMVVTNSILGRLLVYMGTNTIPIVILHILCFKAVNALVVVVHSLPSYYIAAYPVLWYEGFWWIVYTMVGIIVPLLLNYIYQFLRENVCCVLKILRDRK